MPIALVVMSLCVSGGDQFPFSCSSVAVSPQTPAGHSFKETAPHFYIRKYAEDSIGCPFVSLMNMYVNSRHIYLQKTNIHFVFVYFAEWIMFSNFAVLANMASILHLQYSVIF